MLMHLLVSLIKREKTKEDEFRNCLFHFVRMKAVDRLELPGSPFPRYELAEYFPIYQQVGFFFRGLHRSKNLPGCEKLLTLINFSFFS